MLTLNQR